MKLETSCDLNRWYEVKAVESVLKASLEFIKSCKWDKDCETITMDGVKERLATGEELGYMSMGERDWVRSKDFHEEKKKLLEERQTKIINELKSQPKKLSGQMWEECRRCGAEPVYQSLGCLCERCGRK